jgi:hypothetical protein
MVDLFDWEKQEWTGAPSSPSALLSMLIRLPKLKFVIMTLGEHGCVMLERCSSGEFSLFTIVQRSEFLT